ncbi:MAG: sensor histidine kinase [Lachnospiraceae bacterium]|nr:sensor histidine kinase [Lachnospiraceae bacterium]
MEKNNQETYDLPLTLLENERSRIARELHDITIQNLVHTIHQTELISHYMENDPVRAKLELSLLSKNLKDTINDTRNLIYDLKPMAIDDLGFLGALDEYFAYIKTFSKIKFSYEIDDDLDCLTDYELLILFRILQEACTNAMRHSNATDVMIRISKYKECFYKIQIDDNGTGCKKEDLRKLNHYGLEMLEERIKMISGKYKIETDIDKGFHITAIVPMTCQGGET